MAGSQQMNNTLIACGVLAAVVAYLLWKSVQLERSLEDLRFVADSTAELVSEDVVPALHAMREEHDKLRSAQELWQVPGLEEEEEEEDGAACAEQANVNGSLDIHAVLCNFLTSLPQPTRIREQVIEELDEEADERPTEETGATPIIRPPPSDQESK